MSMYGLGETDIQNPYACIDFISIISFIPLINLMLLTDSGLIMGVWCLGLTGASRRRLMIDDD